MHSISHFAMNVAMTLYIIETDLILVSFPKHNHMNYNIAAYFINPGLCSTQFIHDVTIGCSVTSTFPW